MTDSDGLSTAARYAGPTPSGIADDDWLRMVADGANAIAWAQSVPNDCTPEEYAAAAIRAVLPAVARVAYMHAQCTILAEARRGITAAPGRQHVTYTGGLRRAARLLDPLIVLAMSVEEDR